MSDQAWQTAAPQVNELDLINALQSDFTTIRVQFLKDDRFPNNSEFGDKLYTYKVPLHWNVQVNDWVVVLVSSSFKAVRVSQVDSFPQPKTGERTKWAVQKIDAAFYFAVGNAEEQMLQNLHNLRKQREREQLLADLRRTIPGDLLEQSMQQMADIVGGGRAQQPTLGVRFDLSAQVAAAEQTTSSHGQGHMTQQAVDEFNAARVREAQAAVTPAAAAAPAATPSWAKP